MVRCWRGNLPIPLVLVVLTFAMVACQPAIDDWNSSKHTEAINALRVICDENEEIRALLTKTIQQAAIVNPDRKYNPAQSLDEFYDFVDWNVRALPWDAATGVAADKKSLYARVDQGVGYFWFVVQQPLDELKERGYYYPTIEFVSPFSKWLTTYSNCWGDWLSSPESWCDSYFNAVYNDPDWGFDHGWYGHTNTYQSFNEFFARPLVSPDVRPIGSAEVVSCNDGWPKGLWQIDEQSQLVFDEPLIMKTAKLSSIRDLIGEGSAYQDAFAGGTFTHSFLDVNDYHRYHCPVDGKIVELRHIPGVAAGGGYTLWDDKQKMYYYENEVGFQMVETRACAIIETADFGLVAMMPIGMSQICSVNWSDGLHVGQEVHRGEEIGYFLFGGSDIVLLFQEGVDVQYLPAADSHILMGENLLKLTKNTSPTDTEKLARQVEAYAQSHPDGFTIHLPDWMVPTTGIVVSYSGALHSYSELDVFSTVEHALLHDSIVGGWRNTEQNVYVYGSNRIFPEDSLEAAIAFGKANEQIAIYVLSCDSTIYLSE